MEYGYNNTHVQSLEPASQSDSESDREVHREGVNNAPQGYDCEPIVAGLNLSDPSEDSGDTSSGGSDQ